MKGISNFCLFLVNIKKRYNFSNYIFDNLSMLAPKNAVSQEYRFLKPSMSPLLQLFSHIVNNSAKSKNRWLVEKITFWGNLYKNEGFKSIANFALDVLCVPHSNAECERIFSKINLVKTKPRNRLNNKSLNGCLLTAQAVKEQTNCLNFAPTKAMIQNFNQAVWIQK